MALPFYAKLDIMANKISNIKDKLNVNDMVKAANRAFIGHSKKREVRRFKRNLDENCDKLYKALMDGTWKNNLRYRQLIKENNNGKVRHIDSPTLITRIYQHLLLNLLEPSYYSRDNLNGLNCKPGCGISSNNPRKSVLRKIKHVYYDRLDLNYYLVIDQRKCYDHITEKVFRKSLKTLTDDKWLIDFSVDVCFVDHHLPIGTPTSPFVHHVVMLSFDHYVKSLAPFSIRYADDNFLAFHTREEAQAAKWRIKNYWWYNLCIRSKRFSCSIRPMSCPCDFCGYVFHRNNRGVCEHDKGYVRIRRSTAKRAMRCDNDKSWASYFGILRHADSYSLCKTIETKMKLRELTRKIKIDRSMDAKNIDVKDLIGTKFTIYNYDIRYNSQKEPNWIKCLVGVNETIDDIPTGRVMAREFHGNYQNIIQFLLLCERQYDKDTMLPIEDVEIENQCGYIFKNSTNQIKYIE